MLVQVIKDRHFTKLDIDGNQISGSTLAALLQVVPVQKLNIVRKQLSDAQIEPIRQNMIDTKNIKVLYMSHNNMSDRAFGLLAEGIRANVGIEEIQFTHNDLSQPNGIEFIKALGDVSLKKLSLNSCNLTVPCIEALKESLEANLDLIDINLYSNEINAEGASVIAHMLANKTKLKTLGLSNNIIGSGGAREIASVCLPGLTSLTRLAIESNLIGNLGLEGVARALIDNTSLEEIFLYNNDLDDDLMLELSQSLANKDRLVTLGLEYNRIRSRGANHIFNVVRTLPKFERLFISHNLLSEASGEPI